MTYDDNGNIISSESDFIITIDTSADALAMCIAMDPGVPHAPAGVTFEDPCGTSRDKINIPYSQYAFYTYNSQQYATAVSLPGTGSVTVTATPKTYDFTWGGITYHFPYILLPPTKWQHTFSNDPCDGTLTIQKVTSPAGDATPFPITVRNSATNAVVSAVGDTISTAQPKSYSLAPGTYTVTEAAVDGWHQSATTCDSVTVKEEQETTCTITNTRDTGQLKVVKNVVNNNGGTKTYADFHFSVDGGTAQSFEATTGDNGAKTIEVPTGTYTVSEPEQNTMGYATSYSGCTNMVVTRDSVATCTITNDDKPAHLTLIKQVINNNGGSTPASAWILGAAGPTSISGATNTPAVTNAEVSAGTYTLSESAGSSGYTASPWVCTGGNLSGASLSLGLGENVSCTITNDDQPGTLIIRKQVVNDNGGTLTAGDFSYIFGTTTKAFPENPLNALFGEDTLTVDAGSYDVTELNPNTRGYSVSYDNCTDIVVANGGSATCTITNNDDSPTLQLIKLVDNTYGGSATPGMWTLSATGQGTASETSFSGSTGTTSLDLIAGTYVLSESDGSASYQAGTWSCDGVTTVDGIIRLSLGQHSVCTITNTAIAPTLTLRKVVIDDNGGTAAATDWTLTATGTTTISGKMGEATVTNAKVVAGDYTLSEAGPQGYTSKGWTCTGATLNGNVVRLAIGQEAVCTVTNDDTAPSLTLAKIVSNQFGNAAVPADWTLTAAGTTSISGAGGAASDENFKAGTYTLSENGGPSGYTAGPWVCNGAQLAGSTLVIGVGDTVSCTITNSDTPAYISGTKQIVNADSSLFANQTQAAGWTIILQTSTDNGATWSDYLTTQTDKNGNYSFGSLASGLYRLVETMKDGWTQIFAPGTINLGVGGESTDNDFGNFENGWVGGYKWNDRNGDGIWDREDDEESMPGWTVFVDDNANGVMDNGERSAVTDEDGWYEFDDFGPNQAVTICEIMQDGWRQTWPAAGDNCLHFTFTESGQRLNDYNLTDFGNQQLADLTIVKDVQPNSPMSFSFTTDVAQVAGTNLTFNLVDNGGALSTNSKLFSELLPGTYTVTEHQVPMYNLDSIVCTGEGVTMVRDGATLSVTLAPGAKATCTFVNKFVPQVLDNNIVVTPAAAPAPALEDTGTSTLATSLVAFLAMIAAVLVFGRRRQIEMR